MTNWTADEIDRARHELIPSGIRAEDIDDALASALELASYPEPRTRDQLIIIAGLTLSAVCFAFVAWNLIIATAAW